MSAGIVGASDFPSTRELSSEMVDARCENVIARLQASIGTVVVPEVLVRMRELQTELRLQIARQAGEIR